MKEFILSNIDEYNTFEAYYGNPVMEEDFITIPYINMGLMKEHPLNCSEKQLFIDFCFLLIIEPIYVSVYERGIIKNELENYDRNQSKWFSGSFIGSNSVLDAEMEIQATDVYLIIPKGFKTSSVMWMPDFKRFKGKGNIEEERVIAFLSKIHEISNFLPRSVK